MLCLSFNRMVEPSPPGPHLLSVRDVSMAGVGVKIEQEESGGGGGLMTNAEPLKMSPSRDWLGNHPLEARQLTPPLSCSPSVRRNHVRRKNYSVKHVFFPLSCPNAFSVEKSLLCHDRRALQVRSYLIGKAPWD